MDLQPRLPSLTRTLPVQSSENHQDQHSWCDQHARAGKAGQGAYPRASTSEIYGDPVHPQTEDYWGSVNPIGPRSCYDEGKRVAETLMSDYRRQNGVDTRIIRIFNTYGPRMHPEDGRVVSNFIVAALRNEPLVLYGDGQQTRSFCYVSDLIEGILRMMQQENCPGPINLGNPGEFTIRELAEQVVGIDKFSLPNYLSACP